MFSLEPTIMETNMEESKTKEQEVQVEGDLTVGMAIAAFLKTGLSGRKANTIDWYRKRLSKLADWLDPETQVDEVTDSDLILWYAALEHLDHKWGGNGSHPDQDGHLSVIYLHSLVRAARVLFKWLARKKKISSNPALGLNFPKIPKTGRKGISDGDALKILRLAGKGLEEEDPVRFRDYALFKFTETTGCRLCGLANLRIQDLNLEKPEPACRQVVVLEKGDKERAVFLTPDAMDALKAWLRKRPQVKDDQVFLGQMVGRDWRPLTEGGIYEIFKRYAEAAGVKNNWSPHQWRHRFGRKLAQRDVSLGVIAQIMGHDDVAITKNYYGMFAVSELQSIYDRSMVDIRFYL